MRVYRLDQNLGDGGEDVRGALNDGAGYYRSHVEARKKANAIIKAFSSRQKEYDPGFRFADVQWGAFITITACDFDKTGKDTLIRLLNGRGGNFKKEQVVEGWNPQTKWSKEQNIDDEGGE